MPRKRRLVKGDKDIALPKGTTGAAHPATKHGANAQPPAVRVRELEDGIYASLASSAPIREGNALPPADEATVRLAARTLARLESVSEWLDREGPLDRKGKVRSAALWERRLTSTAARLLGTLGMNPQARAKLGVDIKRIDLASAMSNPNPVERAEQLGELGINSDD